MEEEQLEFDITKVHRQRSLSRIGVTFMNAAFFFFIISVISIVMWPMSVVIGIIWIIMLLMVVIATLFVVLFDPEFRALFDNSAEVVGKLAEFFKYTAIVSFILAVAFLLFGILFLRKDKLWTQARKARARAKTIAITGVIALVIAIIVIISNGGFGS